MVFSKNVRYAYGMVEFDKVWDAALGEQNKRKQNNKRKIKERIKRQEEQRKAERE